jgi:lipopolysaccharide cholinephosphotransferase
MNDLQKKEFDLFACFADVCDRLGLPYYLVCGSALGAVKYGGFIPWDDDMDVGMLRADYERFLREAPALIPSHYFLQSYKSDPAYPLIFAKLRDSRTTYVEKGIAHLPVNHGVYIDIFPLDGYPDIPREQKRLERRKRFHKTLLLAALRGNYGPKARFAVGVMRFFGVHKRTGKILTRYEALISRYPPETSAVICNHGNWQGKLEYAPREQYGKGTVASFEGIPVRVPELYDAYLTQKYGDWRADLPPEQQVGHHYYTVMDLETPYTEMIRPSK